jgi:tetratricopeptide (TPR) repeat protein
VPAARSPLRVALLAAAVALASLFASAPARADSARLREARAHYEQAVAHYNLDEYAPALAEFREAYRLKPDPSFLFNIAQCHRRLGENEAALDFYRKYLRSLPDAPNRADVERMIAELHAKEAAAQPEPAPPPATTPVATPTPAPPAPPRLEAPPPAPDISLVVAPSPPPPSPPLYKRWWFWTGVGVIVVSAVVIGVVASAKGPQPYAGTLGPNLPLEVR